MKRIITALAFAVLDCTLHAQIPTQEKTMGSVNCRWWAGVDSGVKLGFIIGFSNAAHISDNKGIQDRFSNATYGEIVQGVDALCAVPENRPIPVHSMMLAFANKTRGASDQEINTSLQNLRKVIAEVEKQ